MLGQHEEGVQHWPHADNAPRPRLPNLEVGPHSGPRLVGPMAKARKLTPKIDLVDFLTARVYRSNAHHVASL